MLDNTHETESYITVNHERLEEIKAQDGNTYVVMPLFSKASYGVEFKEEIKSHGATETVYQKWPVCPYQVVVRNLSAKYQEAVLYVDGHKVGRQFLWPYRSYVFEGISADDGIKELLFSLPRFVTLQEKSSGQGFTRSQASNIGTVKVVWRESAATNTCFKHDYRDYTTNSYTQANKWDAKATGGGAGSGSGGKAHASTTRAGRVIGLNEPRSCMVTSFNPFGEVREARFLYRTQHHLEDILAGGKQPNAAEAAERQVKRERRRKKAKLQQGSSYLTPLSVEDVKVEKSSGPADDEVIVL